MELNNVATWAILLLSLALVWIQILPGLLHVVRAAEEWWAFRLSSTAGVAPRPARSTDPSAAGQWMATVSRWRYVYLGVVVTLGLVLFPLHPWLWFVFLACLLGLPLVVQHRLSLQERGAMERALPDTILKTAGLLRSGQALHQAVGHLAEVVDDALLPCFETVRTDLRIGISLSDALRRQESRLALDEFSLFSNCLRLGIVSGGTLAPTLEQLARDIQSRINLRAKLRVLTVQARGQAWVMSSMPGGLVAVLYLVDPDGLAPLFETLPGKLALAAAFLMNLAGAIWVRRLALPSFD
ncbi:MAG: type II secretion system F family protein [Betaproteobacteria bacterium]|nr:hypothetical protein [Betaproteobacteria bacterium]